MKTIDGGVAQLGERVVRNDEAVGSNPITSILGSDLEFVEFVIAGVAKQSQDNLLGIASGGFARVPRNDESMDPSPGLSPEGRGI